MPNEKVRATSELARILALPRRAKPTEAELVELAARMTELLRRPGGTQKLRPVQALALHDIGVYGGAFCPIGVGEGKTLITLLAPWVLQAQRPLLLLPANLIRKTENDRVEYAKHWLVPNHIRLMSYEILGRVQYADELDDYDPDLIMGDEIHRVKNRHAAVSRRVERRMDKRPTTPFIALSGTAMGESIRDFGHIIRWCLKDNAPVPKTDDELEEWAAALDEKAPNGDELRRFEVGALDKLVSPDDLSTSPNLVTAARRGFRRRLTESPGVVSTVGDGESVACSLYIRALTYKMKPVTEEHIELLRTEMMTPDGWDVSPVDVWRHARELSLGFHNIWDPRPPDDWREARRAWFAFVREVLSRSRTYDSPEHVEMACDAGDLPTEALAGWRYERDRPREGGVPFKPNPVPVWHDDSALKVALEWMKKPGIVWVAHRAFGERLAQISGAPYYAEDGLDANGVFIDNGDPKRAVIASINANREGRNLQRNWSRNLITAPMDRALIWQQLIARTHRPGQLADQVEVDVFVGCIEHVNAWRNALVNAAVIRDTIGSESKLLTADIDWPSDGEIASWRGWRWGRAA